MCLGPRTTIVYGDSVVKTGQLWTTNTVRDRYKVRNLCFVMRGGLGLFLMAAATIPVYGDTVEQDKPLRTAIGGTPWVPTPAPVGPKVVYGTDDRIDLYQESDLERREWAASTCGLVSNSSLQENNDGTFTLRTSAYDVCEEEPFSNQPTAAFCTGFMVGDDIIATAGHCYDSGDISGTRFVFGFTMEDANTPVLTLEEADVYQGVEILGRALAGNEDYAIIRVDRPIVAAGARAFPIRREGEIAVGASVGVIGHPSGLPLKLAFGDNTAVRSNDNSGFFVANLDTYGGNSGSPVINPLTGMIEGILVRGETDFVTVGNCSVSNVVSNSGGRGEDVSKSTSFMQFVPDLLSSDGALSLDQVRYRCDGEIVITLGDADLAGNPTATVQLSTSAGDAETVTLTASPEEGEFSGAIVTQPGDVAPGNGGMEVAEGDLITVSYADASHGPSAPDVVTLDAPVDCTDPIVTGVTVTQIGARYATVQFDTSESARGAVRVGTTCGDVAVQASFAGGTEHSVFVQGLLPLTAYLLAIEVTDDAGNSVVADNGGACFSFATAESSEYYTQVFASQTSDLANSMVQFTPREGGAGYSICHDNVTGLPVDATGATTLVLSDDGFAQVSLSGGALFPYFGSEYDRLFVNTNGNVTFQSGDSSYEATAGTHFSAPRISPCLTDLIPTTSGTVWYRQLANRLVVTWQGLRHYQFGGSNTIQLELYFDGTIRFSYGNLTGLPSVVGLSAGQGALSDFVSTDLSAHAPCENGTERFHSADSDQDAVISLQETLRVIQFFNLEDYHCDDSTEDGFAPGAGSQTCTPHDIDYNPQDWTTSMSEVLRLVQLYNSAGYVFDPTAGTEDGFVPLAAP